MKNQMFSETIAAGVDIRKPGIYQVIIAGAGEYFGRTGQPLRRRIRRYPNNLRNLLAGKPYRKNDPDGYRYIHHEMAWAHVEGRRIDLFVLENIEGAGLRRLREKQLIVERGTLNGSLPEHRRFLPMVRP